MWQPPPDEIVQDAGWQPPADERVDQQPQTAYQPAPYASFPEAGQIANSDASLLGKTWAGLQVPSQMAQRGLNSIAGAIPNPEPTGNLPLDLAKGAPRIAADTLAQAAPSFVNRASILTAGAAQAARIASPAVAAVGRGLGTQLESMTGAKPGALKAAWNDASLIFSKGKGAAKPLYEAAKQELPEGANIFKGMYKPEEIIDTAKEYLGKGGKLEPAEALMYRKAIDSLSRSGRYVKDELFAMRSEADAMAKESSNIAQADPMHQRGVYADSLRQILPQNKHGGASAFKMGIMTGLEQMGLPGKVALAALSPAAVGTAATVGGAVSRFAGPVARSPEAAVALSNALLQEYYRRKTQQ